MAITAHISSDEVTAQVTNRFVNQYFEGRLINAELSTSLALLLTRLF